MKHPPELEDPDRIFDGAIAPFDLDTITVYEDKRALELSLLTICIICLAVGILAALWFMEEV